VRGLAIVLVLSLGSGVAAADKIHDAASKGDLKAVKKLLKKHPAWANLHDKGGHGATPLIDAITADQLAVV
jgi:hypothetical protein